MYWTDFANKVIVCIFIFISKSMSLQPMDGNDANCTESFTQKFNVKNVQVCILAVSVSGSRGWRTVSRGAMFTAEITF